jgi:hypothetical protein
MISIIRNGRFLMSAGPCVFAVLATTAILLFMVMVSRNNSVRTPDASCKVGEVVTSSETINIQLECEEAGTTTSTSTSQPANVVAIVKSQPPKVVCNVMRTGWARDCRVP